MSTQPQTLTVEDLGKAVKSKYGGVYDDLGDAELGQRIQAKYPGAYDDYAPIARPTAPVATPAQVVQPYAAQPPAPPPGQLMHPQQVEAMTAQNAQAMAPAFAQAQEEPSILDNLRSVFTGNVNVGDTAIGRAMGIGQEKIQGRQTPTMDLPLVKFEGALPPQNQQDPNWLKAGLGAATGAAKLASGMTTPENIAIMAATSGLGAVGVMGRALLPRLVSAGFSLEMIKGLYDQAPAVRDAIKSGDYGKAAEALTMAAGTAALAALGVRHAVKGGGPAAPKPEEGTATITGKELYRPPAEPAQAPAQAPAQQPAAKPVGPQLSDQDLQRLLKIETNPAKRGILAAMARARGVPVPEVPHGPRVPVGKLAEGPTRTEQTLEYGKLFDEAEARTKKLAAKKARTAPVIPETGDADQRRKAARDDIARKLTGKGYDEIDDDGRDAVDALVKEGYTGAQREAPSAKPTPAQRAKQIKELRTSGMSYKQAMAQVDAKAKAVPAKTQVPDVKGVSHLETAKTEPVQQPAPATAPVQSVAEQPQVTKVDELQPQAPAPKAKRPAATAASIQALSGRLAKIRELRAGGMTYKEAVAAVNAGEEKPAASEAASRENVAERHRAQEAEEAKAETPAPKKRGEPGWVGNVPTSSLHVDPTRFQFKRNVGQGGAGEEFREVGHWDPEKAGVVSVWRDPADGKDYVVNGHHRYEMATRLGAPEMTVRYLDAPNAAEARTKGALINIAEGRGESTDAAKVFRDSGMSVEELKRKGISLQGKIASEGLGLSKLAQSLFEDVLNGDLPAARGALVGSMVERPQDQIALYDLLKQREASGKRLTNDQIGELIRLNNAAPTKTTSSADDAQQSMFGAEEMTRSLLPEKAEISDYVRKQLGQERKLFSTVGSEGAAQTLGAAGNVIDAKQNASIAEKANQAQMLYDKFSSGAGPVGNALDLASKRLADGEPANEVKRETYRTIRAHLIEQANQLTGVSRVGTEGIAGHDREGTHQVNPVRPVRPGSAPAKEALEIPSQPVAAPPATEGNEAYREQIRHAEEKARAQWNVGPASALKSGEALEDSPLFGGPRQGDMFGEGGGGLFGDEEEPAGGILGTGNPEAGALDISFLVKALDKLFPGDVAKANYSGLGALKNIFVRNLSQLAKVSPSAHAAAVRAASSKSQVAVLLRSAVPEIEHALGPDISWEKFRRTLIESRLRGIRARWEDWARQSGNKSIDGFRKGMQNGLMNILEQIEGQHGIPQDVRETALALLHNVDGKPLTDAEQMKLVASAQQSGLGGNGLTKIRQLQAFMQRTFSDAARSVAHVMDPAEFDATIKHPNFAAGLKTYKDLLEKPVAENHAINEGVFSTALGPARTYYPLIPLEETQAPDISQKRPTPFAKPKNIANELATGLAPDYDVSMSALESRLSRAIKGNNKAAMFTALEDAGLLKPLDVGERASPFMEINGERYHAKTIELAEPQQRIVKGTLENVPAKFALVPDWLHKELEPIVKRGDLRISRPRQIIDAITQTALAGPSDMVFHATNLLGTLVANTPYLGDSLGAKTVGNTPFTKIFTAIVKMANTDPMNAAAVPDLMQMAQAGVLPDRYGSVTYSRKFAEQTGAELKRFSPSPILYGPKGLDARARLLMWRLSKELAPNATVAERAQFTNQLGNYVSALQGPIERALKSSVAPFYTAGSAMYRNGLNAVLGTGPMPGNRFEYRVAQQLSGGMVGFAAVWVIAHKATTGKWPWDDPKSKFGQLPIPDSVRRSAGGKALFGPGTDTGYVNLALFNPILMRGARALGLSGAYNARAIGGDASRMIESAIKDMGNSVIEPATTGPIVKAGTILATGNEPYVTSVNPFRMMPATDPKKHGAAMLAERSKEAVLNMNNFFQNLGASTGFGHRADEIATKGDRWLKMVTAIALPRLFSQSDVGRQAGKVASERRLAKRTALMDTLVHSLEQGKGIPPDVLEAYRAGELTRRDIAEAKRESRETPLQRKITHMPIGEAIDEYAAATPEQRTELRGILSKKARAAMANEAGAQRAATLEALRGALAQ